MNARYYAIFTKIGKNIIRNDTRIYYTDETPKKEKGRCLGVVIAKYPGLAFPKNFDEWTELELGEDNMLSNIKGLFENTFERIKFLPKVNDYIRILNLINIRMPDNLTMVGKNIDLYIEKAENDLEKAPLIFIGWSDGVELNPYREIWINILRSYESKCLYVTYKIYRKYKIAYGIPNIGKKVRHPQGMPHQIVLDNIEGILKKFLSNQNHK